MTGDPYWRARLLERATDASLRGRPLLSRAVCLMVTMLGAMALPALASAESNSSIEVRQAGEQVPAVPTNSEPYEWEHVAVPSVRLPSFPDAAYDVWRPANLTGPRPALLMIPDAGAPGCSSCSGVYPGWQSAAEAKGWIVIIPNNDIPDMSDFNGWALQLHFIESLEDAEARYAIDPTQVFVAGGSKGAVASVNLAFLYPDLFAGVVGDSGDYDAGARGDVGFAAQQSPVQEPPLPNAAAPLPVVGANPFEAPWSYDEFSPQQLANDSGPHAEGHELVFPEYSTTAFPAEASTPFNATGMPVALIAGAEDPVAPAPITGLPFYAWLSQLGYTTRYILYPNGGHVPSAGDAPAAYDFLTWLQQHARGPKNLSLAYQSDDLVNPEDARLDAWPYYSAAGSSEGTSLPIQAARHDRSGGLVLGDPWLYRLRVAFSSDQAREWKGSLSLTGGKILFASAIDDGVGLDGSDREVSGSTALTPPRRLWLEPGDELQPGARPQFDLHTNGAQGDRWDMVTLEIAAGPGAVLRLRSPGKSPQRIPQSEIRSSTEPYVRTLDRSEPGGTLRVQVLQPQSWWWSQLRFQRSGNAAALWLRDLADEQLELGPLGLENTQPLTLRITGDRRFTGENTITLDGDWSQFSGQVLLDGQKLRGRRYSLTDNHLRIPLGDVRGRTATVVTLPARGESAPAAPALSWRSPTAFAPDVILPRAPTPADAAAAQDTLHKARLNP